MKHFWVLHLLDNLPGTAERGGGIPYCFCVFESNPPASLTRSQATCTIVVRPPFDKGGKGTAAVRTHLQTIIYRSPKANEVVFSDRVGCVGYVRTNHEHERAMPARAHATASLY